MTTTTRYAMRTESEARIGAKNALTDADARLRTLSDDAGVSDQEYAQARADRTEAQRAYDEAVLAESIAIRAESDEYDSECSECSETIA